MNNDFSLNEKKKYYENRVNDKSLTFGQRQYACSFLEGVEQQEYNLKGRKLSVSEAEGQVNDSKKLIVLNEKNGGDSVYFKGYLAVAEDRLRKAKKS